ncbi:MAG: endonuclease [Candidatus Eisenbacteria bacterium]|nr:endonuclease [Candidatus Eisenbacteria bacterium]
MCDRGRGPTIFGQLESPQAADPSPDSRKEAPALRPTRALALAALSALILGAAPAKADLILSELCDPKVGYQTDRFIEIYNTGPGSMDLTGWSVVAIANGVDACTWPLSGTLPAGQARVCGHTSTSVPFVVNFQNPIWNTYTSQVGAYNWNGGSNDGAKLISPGSVVVDLIGNPGAVFTDGHLVRNASVTTGSPSYVASEWTYSAVNLATDATPGTHNGSTPPPGGPVISNVVIFPASPAANDPVSVNASVVDTSGAIASVTLDWGPSAGSLTNHIAMSLVADSTYAGDSPIPGQAAGATVHYRVTAVGASATSQSPTASYAIPGAGGSPPAVLSVGEMSDSTLLVIFSEPVEETSAEAPANYVVDGLVAVNAARDGANTSWVTITVRNLPAGSRTLTVSGVADLGGSTAFGATCAFNYVDVRIPAGYYDGIVGLKGSALRWALHERIKNHTVRSYSYVLTAFATTDVKWNGKIWDVYSDIPGGTPPYEYAIGQTGQGATEGLGYNREHSFPQSWFGGASPMYSDIFHLYPTDAKVNGYRANYAYGAVAVPTTTSWNGSKLGPSASPGFTGTVFEPIDPFKGDLVRSQFYMATRYLGEDAGWPGSDSFDGAEMKPWAVAQYLDWAANDPVSWKERMRNGAVYVLQGNRNPFIDHPEFVAAIWDSNSVTGVEPPAGPLAVRLSPAYPNPARSGANLTFDLPATQEASLEVFDIQGHRVTTLASGRLAAGSHAVVWSGRDDAGRTVSNGIYFVRLSSGGLALTRRLTWLN